MFSKGPHDHATGPQTAVLWIAFALLWTSATAYAQGCSDAGFCSIDALRPNQQKEEVLRDQFRIGTFYGNADHAIAVYGMSIAYDDAWSSSWRSEIKLTSLAQSSEAIQTFGLSDVLINIHFQASQRMGLSAGIKWPLSDASNELDGLPLPMDHQSSLGTHDLIFGFSYVSWGIQWAAALQQPLTQNNNQFLSSFYPSENELSAFPSTNAFNRSGDAVALIFVESEQLSGCIGQERSDAFAVTQHGVLHGLSEAGRSCVVFECPGKPVVDSGAVVIDSV